MIKLDGFSFENKIFVACDFCRKFHPYSSAGQVKCYCSPQVKGTGEHKQTVYSPYQAGFEIVIAGEFTETILKEHLRIWKRKHPDPNEDVFY